MYIIFIILVSILVNTCFFINSVFNDMFYVNKIAKIFYSNLVVTGLLKVTGNSITLLQQGNKHNIHKIVIILEK